jgi:hypothetical protein
MFRKKSNALILYPEDGDSKFRPNVRLDRRLHIADGSNLHRSSLDKLQISKYQLYENLSLLIQYAISNGKCLTVIRRVVKENEGTSINQTPVIIYESTGRNIAEETGL